jgi:hypothetical protein
VIRGHDRDTRHDDYALAKVLAKVKPWPAAATDNGAAA